MALLAGGALVACGASSAERPATKASAQPATKKQEANSEDATKRFVADLIRQSATRIVRDPKSCLASQAGAVTIGAELAAIMGWYIDAGWAFGIEAGCEAGEGPTRQFCRMYFFHKDDDNEASAGFTFLGNPADGRIDPATLECFHTP